MKKLLCLFFSLLLAWNALAQNNTYPQPVSIYVSATNTFSYSVTALRNYSTYPLTTQGVTDFQNAVVSGTFNLTTTDGCVIPAGTKPPKVKPTCTTGPSYTVIQVAYNQTIESEGVGAVGPGNTYGTVKDGELTYTLPNMPVPGSYTMVLAYQSNTTAPVALVSVNGGAAQSFQLEASEGGPRTKQAVLSGFVAGNNQINIKQNGYFASDKITVSRYGSATVTQGGSTTTTNPGSETSVTDPTQDYVSQTDEGWVNSEATDMKFIENQVMKLGFRRQVGGAICYAGLKSNNRNMVNDPIMNDALPNDPYGRYGQLFRDKGRQWMFAPYYSPGSGYIVNGKSTADYFYDTGGNVVQGGSLGRYYDESVIVASRVYNHPKFGQTYYVKVQPRVWGVPGELVDIYIEQWTHFASPTSTVATYFERTHIGNIQTSQFRYEARAQELPCFYSIAPLTHQRMVDRDAAPWTGGSTVDRFKYGFGNNNNFTKAYATPECWMSLGEGADGQTVGLYTPGVDRGDGKKVGLNSRFKAGQFVDVWGDSDDLASAYGTANPMVNFDNSGIYETAGYFVLGNNLADVRSKITALPRPDQSFNFNFTNDSHMWWNLNCRMKKEGGAVKAYLGDLNNDGGTHGEFKSPFGAWDASQIHTIEFDMAVTGASAFWLEWNKMGEENDDSRRFRKLFSGLNGDGQRRTYTISTTDANWSGIIATIGLKAIASDGPVTPAGASVTVYGIKKLN